jgi:putative mRNA 3-end processing factor
MPVYKWQPQAEVFAEINDWWRENNAQGKVSIISAYALGKAQRIMQNVDPGIGRIFTHGAVENINEVMRKQGIPLVETTRVHSTIKKDEYKGGLVIAPPSAVGGNWTRKFQPFSVAIASGWMNLRGARRRRNADRGFVLSDHADWDGLNQAVADTGASKVIVTHGYTEVFTKWLREQGYEAYGEKTQFESETPDDSLA